MLFGAQWCKNCSKLKSAIGELSIPIPVLKIDVDEVPEVSDSFGVNALPHSTFIHNGVAIKHYLGSDIAVFQQYVSDLIALGSGGESSQVVSTVDAPGETEGAEPTVPHITELAASFELITRIFETKEGGLPLLSFDLLKQLSLPTLAVCVDDVESVKSGLSRRAAAQASLEFDAGVVDTKLVRSLFVFSVPLVTLDGTCSLSHRLAKQPFNLAVDAYHLYSSHEEFETEVESLINNTETRRLLYLKHVVSELNHIIQADWIGIYRLVDADGGVPSLLKEAYQGEPSRAVFPVTEAFATKSTNSWVALTGNVRLIDNIHARDSSVSYYECSGKVQSELCVPIYQHATSSSDSGGGKSKVIGIIDLESWKVAHFNAAKVLQVIQTAFEVGATNFGLKL